VEPHWLVRRSTIRRLWVVFGAVLVAVVLAELATAHEAQFAVERLFGFYAWFGFAACAILIVGAKVIGALLKRPDTYYHEDARDD
jgi:sterol desaturase/sphingolipid hydroxylase (fatty acid hydroxylase superfamily)